MPITYYTEKEYRKVADKVATLEKNLAAAEAMRPQWAQGHSTDSIAAQMSAAALQQVWLRLGVDNQTDCMKKLRALDIQKDA